MGPGKAVVLEDRRGFLFATSPVSGRVAELLQPGQSFGHN